MTAPLLQPVIDGASAVLAGWNSFVENLSSLEGPQREAFDLDQSIPNLSPQTTVKQLETKLTGAVSLVHSLSSIESLDLIPDGVVNEISSRVGAVRTAVEKLSAQLTAFETDSPIAALDHSGMTANNEKGQQINLPPIFIELYPAIQSLLTALYQIRTMAGVGEKDGFGLQFSYIDSARSAQRRTYGELNRLRRAAGVSKQKLDDISSTAKSTSDEILSAARSASQEIENMKAAASQAVQVAQEQQNKAEALNAAASQVAANATTLKSSVSDYQQTFNQFQEQLDQRNKQFERGQVEQTRLLAAISQIEDQITQLRNRSREVLGEATMSGLSESFAREMQAAEKKLFRTQILFFVSIVLLLMSAGIVLNAFPWLENHGFVRAIRWEPPAGTDSLTIGVFYLGNFLGKGIFLLPSLLLLGFAARRYSEAFRLKTLYTYKYTVAASLPGFKVEAPTYAEAITAAAFQQLLSNPSDVIEKSEDSTKEGGSFLQRLIEPVVKKALDKMSEMPKGGSH